MYRGLPFNIYEYCWFAENVRGTSLSEVQYWMTISALRRGDEKRAIQNLRDWKILRDRPKTDISKFVPGEHYHVLDKKFDSFGEACQYLEKCGYGFGRLKEVHIYAKEGD
jgi:hypothetical protein